MAENTTFYALGIQVNYLEKTTLIRSTLHPLIHHLLQKFCYYTVNKSTNLKKKLDGQSSSLLTSMQVFDYNATFSPVHLVFLEL